MCVENLEPISTTEDEVIVYKIASKYDDRLFSLIHPAMRDPQNMDKGDMCPGTTFEYFLGSQAHSSFQSSWGLYVFPDRNQVFDKIRNDYCGIPEDKVVLECKVPKGTKFYKGLYAHITAMMVEQMTPLREIPYIEISGFQK